ncbi:MAG: hypothetical protein ACOCVR_02015, partial [Myxococcota bacterium]
AVAAHARSAVTPRLRELMTALALRRESLEVPARLSLFRKLATHLEALGIERPPSISEERFVLGVTAAVLEDGRSSRSAAPEGPPAPEPAFGNSDALG